MTERIQRQRTKGWRMPEGAVYVGRPSRWGNPYRVGETYMSSAILTIPVPTWRDPGDYDHALHVERVATTDRAVEMYRLWISAATRMYGVEELRGRDLVCWCPLDQPCHADVLLELANR